MKNQTHRSKAVMIAIENEINKIVINGENNKNDLLAQNFATQRPFEKIGMDGTWFKNWIINGKKNEIFSRVSYWYA